MAQICMIQLPATKLLDSSGRNWTAVRRFEPKGSAQIVISQLRGLGHDVVYEDLKLVATEKEIGHVQWTGKDLTKIAVGRDWTELRAGDFEVWGMTVNFLQERDLACMIIRHLSKNGGKVVVGGSDALAVPEPYLRAGAAAVVGDKSGKVNRECIEAVLGGGQRRSLPMASGSVFTRTGSPLSPQDWPLPDLGIVKQTMGVEYWEGNLPPHLYPIGSVMLDLGCDRKCDFCQTPTYKVGYRPMTPDRAKAWLDRQKEAGANSVVVLSDQFLGRVLWKGGRADILEILQHARSIGLALLYGNGIEMKKATLGRSLPNSNPAVDEELVNAVWGWDGERGCAQAFLPAERPHLGGKAYPKLLEWQEHVAMMEAIVRSGVPDISYGCIVGLREDSRDSLEELLAGTILLKQRLKDINPNLHFRITPFAVRPIPGTRQTALLSESGLIEYDDVAIQGGFWTPCARTEHLSVEEIAEWQERLVAQLSDPEPEWQGLTRWQTADAESLRSR